MTSKLTREELLNIIDTDHVQCGEASALARMALTAMDSEPVAWTWRYREKWHVTNDKCRAEFVAKDGDVDVLPLYRHAQQPVVPGDPVKDAEFYERAKRENTPVKTGTCKDKSPAIGISLVSIARRTSQLLRQLDYEPNAKSGNPIEVLLFDAEKAESDIKEAKEKRAAMLNGGKP
ncbi:hypothetical protein AAHL48_004091 [Klebsiella pneumoniae]